MSSDPDHPLRRMVRKLRSRTALDQQDREAVLALPHTVRSFHASTYVIREGQRPAKECAFVQSGFAFRQKLTSSGTRQIVSLHFPGDFLDLQHLFLNIADHNVQALTELEVVAVDRAALQQLVLSRPNVGRALWIDALVDSSIYREWVTNVGRRDAAARIAHLLCETGLRMEAAGLIPAKDSFELPLTQEQLADAVGLTPVHVNRTLKSLIADGVVHKERRYMTITDWNRVAEVGDFNGLYLHLDQAGPQ